MRGLVKPAFAVCMCLTLYSTIHAPAAHMIEKDNVQVIHPWAEATEGDTARVFPTIANSGNEEIEIVGAEAPVAAGVALIVDGQPVDRIVVPGGDVVNLDGADNHLHLRGLRDPLEEGGQFPLLLKFGDGGTMTIDVVIGENTLVSDLSALDRAKINLTHDPIPALGWPTMTMELALFPGADIDGLVVGDGVVFELERGPDGIYGIAAIWRAGTEPAAVDDVIRAHGVLNAPANE